MIERPFTPIDETRARAWCESLARTWCLRRIPATGSPYLERYSPTPYSPSTHTIGPSIFLHHFVGSDPDGAVHSHPWDWSLSLILVGGYIEHRCDERGHLASRAFWPGEINVLTSNDKHRIDLVATDCWTVFLAGTYIHPWQFSREC